MKKFKEFLTESYANDGSFPFIAEVATDEMFDNNEWSRKVVIGKTIEN